jgi:hypothetical protein
VKEKLFLRGKASYKVKSSDWRFARVTKAVLGKYRLETASQRGLAYWIQTRACPSPKLPD